MGAVGLDRQWRCLEGRSCESGALCEPEQGQALPTLQQPAGRQQDAEV